MLYTLFVQNRAKFVTSNTLKKNMRSAKFTSFKLLDVILNDASNLTKDIEYLIYRSNKSASSFSISQFYITFVNYQSEIKN